MSDDLAAKISREIAHIEEQLDEQKRLIRHSTGNAPVTEAARAELKSLHSRLAVLQSNLHKLEQ